MLRRLALLKALLLLSQSLNPSYTMDDLNKALQNQTQEIVISESGGSYHHETKTTSSVIKITTSTTQSALNITTHSNINLSYTIKFDDIQDIEYADSVLYVNGEEVAKRENNKGIFLGTHSFPYRKIEIPYAEHYHILLETKSFGKYEFDIDNNQALEFNY